MKDLVTCVYQQNQPPMPQQPNAPVVEGSPPYAPQPMFDPQHQPGPDQNTAPPQNHVQLQHCTPEELKVYARAVMGFLQPGQGLTHAQTMTLVGMVLGLQIPEPVRVQHVDQNGQIQRSANERLLTIDQDANYFNKGKRPKNVQLINKPKNPLKQHHMNDPREMRKMTQFEMDWEASQRGVPDGVGAAENPQLFKQYPY